MNLSKINIFSKYMVIGNMMKTKKCCDNCERYRWYYNYCKKWKCEVDDRGVCGSWTERVKPKDTDIARKQEQKISGKI